MNATRIPSVPPTALRRLMVPALAAGTVAGMAAALPSTALAAVFADVVSSTPVTAFVPVQRRDCGPIDRRSVDASTVDPNSQPVGDSAGASARCRTVTVRTQRVVAHDVVYEIGGVRETVRLDRDPGARVELGVVAQAARPVGRPLGEPVGQPVPGRLDDGAPVEAAPSYRYGEQRPIGAGPQTTTTVIVEQPYGYGYGYPYGLAYGYPWFGPSIGIGFWGGGWWGHGSRHWHRGHDRPSPPKHMFHHRGGGGPDARR
jgi:uncharacterized protein YcfJ